MVKISIDIIYFNNAKAVYEFKFGKFDGCRTDS